MSRRARVCDGMTGAQRLRSTRLDGPIDALIPPPHPTTKHTAPRRRLLGHGRARALRRPGRPPVPLQFPGRAALPAPSTLVPPPRGAVFGRRAKRGGTEENNLTILHSSPRRCLFSAPHTDARPRAQRPERRAPAAAAAAAGKMQDMCWSVGRFSACMQKTVVHLPRGEGEERGSSRLVCLPVSLSPSR